MRFRIDSDTDFSLEKAISGYVNFKLLYFKTFSKSDKFRRQAASFKKNFFLLPFIEFDRAAYSDAEFGSGGLSQAAGTK